MALAAALIAATAIIAVSSHQLHNHNHLGRGGVHPRLSRNEFLDVTPKASLFAAIEAAVKNVRPASSPLSAPATAGCDASSISLAAGRTLLCVSSTTGNITGLWDTPTGQPFHYPGVQTTVFQLGLAAALSSPHSNDPIVPLSSSSCASTVVSGGGSAPILWSFTACTTSCAGAPVSATVTMAAAVRTLSPSVPDVIAFTMNVTDMPSSCAVSTAGYPYFVSPATLVDAAGGSDAFLSPTGDGTLIPSIGQQHVAQQDSYPGQACVQMMARLHTSGSNATLGLLMAALDDAAFTKSFAMYSDPVAGFSVMQLDALLSEVPGGDVQVGYPVVLSSFAGDWHSAALLYKAWADEQWWTARIIRERSDLPTWMLDGSVGMVAGIQNGSGFVPEEFGPHLEQLPAWAAQIAAAVGAPHTIFVPYGWEHDGMWAGIFYDPPQPDTASWTSVIQNMTANGGNAVAFLVSGYWWVVRRQETTCGPAFNHTDLLEPLSGMLIKLRNGSAFSLDQYDAPNGPLPWVGYSTHMCHGAGNASATILDIFSANVDLGVQLVSFDQEIGGGQYVGCYDESHGHPIGWGSWMFEGINATMAAIHAYAAARNTTVNLCTEQTSELLIPSVATFYARQYAPTNWPWNSNIGGTAVGLFSFLYHEYLPVLAAEFSAGITGPFDVAFLLRYAVAASLTQGTKPFYSSWMITNNISLAAQAYGPAYTGFAPHLLSARSIVPPSVYTSLTYGTQSNVTVSLRNVLSGAFIDDGDASVLFILAQATVTPQTYTVNFTTWSASPQVVTCTGQMQLQAANGTLLATWPVMPASTSATLQPLDVHVYSISGCTAVTRMQ